MSQSKYVKNLVKRFGFETTKHKRTPIGINVKLTKDENCSSVDPTLCRSMIGNLLYLTVSHPDICYSVGVCARYQANAKASYLTAVRKIICYINVTVDFGIWYSKDTYMNLVDFCDANWVGNADDRKNNSECSFYLGNNLISWHNKK